MTQEEKAKRYDEAFEKAKMFHERELYAECNGNLVEYIFPELKESEDERIRKWLIDYFKENNAALAFRGISNESVLAWLEKQCEQKETLCDKCRKEQPSHSCQDITALGRCALENQGKQKPAWSEENEDTIKFLISHFCVSHYNASFQFTSNKLITHDELLEKIRNLRPQNRWKPSDEQMKALEHAINCYSGISPTNTEEVYTLEIMKDQLKKLREE